MKTLTKESPEVILLAALMTEIAGRDNTCVEFNVSGIVGNLVIFEVTYNDPEYDLNLAFYYTVNLSDLFRKYSEAGHANSVVLIEFLKEDSSYIARMIKKELQKKMATMLGSDSALAAFMGMLGEAIQDFYSDDDPDKEKLLRELDEARAGMGFADNQAAIQNHLNLILEAESEVDFDVTTERSKEKGERWEEWERRFAEAFPEPMDEEE